MRHKILLGGDTNSGKTLTIIQLAVMFPDRQVWAFDAEGDICMTLEDLGLELPNLTVKEVKPDWDELTSNYQQAKQALTPNDWCCFDMMGVFWDLAGECFSKMAFGTTMAERQVSIIREKGRADFQGFDGLDHWPTIKRMHNTDLIDDAVRWSPFNVLATTSLVDYSPKEKVPKTGFDGIMAKEFGKKLEGEKHNKFRFRTISVIYERGGHYLFKLPKLKGSTQISPLPEYDFTGMSWFQKYTEVRGIEL